LVVITIIHLKDEAIHGRIGKRNMETSEEILDKVARVAARKTARPCP
jgi:hypothetical protein